MVLLPPMNKISTPFKDNIAEGIGTMIIALNKELNKDLVSRYPLRLFMFYCKPNY